MCTLFHYLLNLQQSDAPATTYIRALEQGRQCEDGHVLAENRQQYRAFISQADPTAFDRILRFQETERDEKIALQAVVMYHHQDRKSLIAGLGFWERLQYRAGLLSVEPSRYGWGPRRRAGPAPAGPAPVVNNWANPGAPVRDGALNGPGCCQGEHLPIDIPEDVSLESVKISV